MLLWFRRFLHWDAPIHIIVSAGDCRVGSSCPVFNCLPDISLLSCSILRVAPTAIVTCITMQGQWYRSCTCAHFTR